LLMGRKVQRHYKVPEQDVLTTPLLIGLDGEKKMGKSAGNYIPLNDAPEDMFGKLMSMRDEMIIPYFRALTDISEADIKKHEAALAKGENPKNVKEKLAEAVVARYHGDKKARATAEKWGKLFSKRDVGVDLPEVKVPNKMKLVDLVVLCFKTIGVEKSKSEARRLISSNAVQIDNMVWSDVNALIDPQTEVVKIGRHYFRLLPEWSL